MIGSKGWSCFIWASHRQDSTNHGLCWTSYGQCKWFTLTHFSSLVLAGVELYTLSFRFPYKKNSRGLKSGKCGGYSWSVLKEMKLRPNVCDRYSITLPAVCGVAPSCWNFISSMFIPFLLNAGMNSSSAHSESDPYLSCQRCLWAYNTF
jgi:hypothetical protein